MKSPVRSLCAGLLVGLVLGCGGGDGTGPDANAVASVVVTPSTGSLNAVGATTSFSAQARNSAGAALSGKTFSWTSDATGVATVNATSGVSTAVANGTATIRATATGTTVSGTATVTVQQVVATIGVTPPTGNAFVGGAVQFQAAALDAGGAPVVSPNVTWSSSNTAVATISNLGLATAVGPGSSTITVSAGTPSATAVMNAQYRSLSIGQDTTLSGNVTFNQVTIPAGRTVTVTGPLTMTATGRINIAGTLTGSCVPFIITGDTAITVTGAITNGCDTGTPASLRLSANGALELDGALITSSGDITLQNDPTLAASSFPYVPRVAKTSVAAAAGPKSARVNNSTVRYHGAIGPAPAAGGGNGNPGFPGNNGRDIQLLIQGDALFAGTTVWGQDGGKGGDGVAPGTTSNLSVTAGKGGDGGKTSIVVVNGTLTFDGTGNTVRSGRGGNGGNATATTLENALFGVKGPTAVATAGDGGQPGLVDIRASAISVVLPTSLTFEITPGAGGNATATGARGANATPTLVAQEGGDAAANGGRGGSTPNDTLMAGGLVTGFGPTIVANGGRGGNATTTSGNGGDGLKPNKDGGRGGRATPTGGHGGDASIHGTSNNRVGTGGAAGSALMTGGNGGAGWNDCVSGQEEEGGAGGAGASVGTFVRGRGGRGAINGADSEITYGNTGNGGNGGRGFPAGRGGAAGGGPASPFSGVVLGDVFTPPTFTAGTDGVACPPLLPNAPPSGAHFYMQIAGWSPLTSQGFMSPGPYNRPLLNAPNGTAVGQVTITTIANQFNVYYMKPNPNRIGPAGPTTGWDLNVASVMEGTTFPNIEFFHLCFLNEQPALSPTNQIIVQQRDNFGVVVAQHEFGGPAGPIADGRRGCVRFGFHLLATHVRWFRQLSGSVDVDWVAFEKKLTP